MRRGRIPVLVALAAAVALLGGCWDYVDLERRAIILAVGVDVDPDRAGELRLSVEVPSPSVPPQQSMEAAGAGPRKVVAHATGVSIVEAANRLRGRLERQPLWTQVIAVVVGEPVARQGVARVLDVFMRYDPLNARAYLYLTDGEAQAVLEQMPNAQALTALSLSTFTTQAPFFPEAIRPRDIATIHRELKETGSTVVARITILGDRLHMAGGGVLKDGVLVGWLDPQDTVGTNWLLGRVNRAPIPLTCPGDPDAYVVVWARLTDHRVSVTLDGGRPRFHIRLGVAGRLVDMARCPLDPENPGDLRQLVDAMTATVRGQAERALMRAQEELQVDYLRLGEQLRRRYPHVWRAIDWQAVFPQTDVVIDVRAHGAGIESPGLVRWTVPYN